MTEWIDFLEKRGGVNDPGGWAMKTPEYKIVHREGVQKYEMPNSTNGNFGGGRSWLERQWNDLARHSRASREMERQELIRKSRENGGTVPAEPSMFHFTPEGNYLRGRFLRGVGKGLLEAPAQLPGVFAGMGAGLAALASGDKFRDGWDFGTGKWEDYVGRPWHKFVSWASTPVREGYDKAHAELLNEIRSAKGTDVADALSALASRSEVYGDVVGGLLGFDAAHSTLGALKATGSVGRAANVARKGADFARKAGKATTKGYVGSAYAYPVLQGAKDIYDTNQASSIINEDEWAQLSEEEMSDIFTKAIGDVGTKTEGR